MTRTDRAAGVERGVAGLAGSAPPSAGRALRPAPGLPPRQLVGRRRVLVPPARQRAPARAPPVAGGCGSRALRGRAVMYAVRASNAPGARTALSGAIQLC